MSAIDITVGNDFWDDSSIEGVVLMWSYADGATVKEGDVLLEIAVEKAQLEVKSPATGKLRILAAPETIIRIDQVLGTIETA
jgi:pyruvate/2-oxoglutarate dehydrogenase complex dihydrolipoamide acyltransferase (E2) component